MSLKQILICMNLKDDDEKEEKDLSKLISGDQGEMVDIDDI